MKKLILIPLLLLICAAFASAFGYTSYDALVERNISYVNGTNPGNWVLNNSHQDSYAVMSGAFRGLHISTTYDVHTGGGLACYALNSTPPRNRSFVNISFYYENYGQSTPGSKIAIGFKNTTRVKHLTGGCFAGVFVDKSETFNLFTSEYGNGGSINLDAWAVVDWTKWDKQNITITLERLEGTNDLNMTIYWPQNMTPAYSYKGTLTIADECNYSYVCLEPYWGTPGAPAKSYRTVVRRIEVGPWKWGYWNISQETKTSRDVTLEDKWFGGDYVFSAPYFAWVIPPYSDNAALNVTVLNMSFLINPHQENMSLLIGLGLNHSYLYNLSPWTTNYTVELNESILKSCMNNWVDECVLRFESNQSGSFNLSSINITYVLFGNQSWTRWVVATQQNDFKVDFAIGLNANSTFILNYAGYNVTASTLFQSYRTLANTTFHNQSDGSHDWYWHYYLSLANGSEWRGDTQSLGLSQEVKGLSFDSCSVGDANETFKMVMVSETKNVSKSLNLDVWFKVWFTDEDNYLNFSFSKAAAATHSFCMDPRNTTFYTTAMNQFNKEGAGFNSDYRTRTYWLHDKSFNGTRQDVYLYAPNTTSAATYVYVKDLNDQPIVGAFVHAQRFYPGTNEWRTVEVGLTDLNGQMVMWLFQNTERYRFYVYYAGQVYDAGEMVIGTSIITINVDLAGYYADDYNIVEGVIYTLETNAANDTFELYYNDQSGEVDQGCLRVRKLTARRDITLFSECASTQSATISYKVTETMLGRYVATAWVVKDGSSYLLEEIEVHVDTAKDVFGSYGLMWAAILILTLGFIGLKLAGAAGAGLFLIIGIMASSIMGLMSLLVGSIITIVVIIGIIIVRGKA